MNTAIIMIGFLLLLTGILSTAITVIILIVNAVRKKPVKKTLKWTGITAAATVVGLALIITGAVKKDNETKAENAGLETTTSASYDNSYEGYGDDGEEELPVALNYKESEAKMDENGKYKIEITVNEGYKAKIDSDEDNNASLSNKGSNTYILSGSFKSKEESEDVHLFVEAANDSQDHYVTIDNSAVLAKVKEQSKQEAKELTKKLALENEVELTYGKLNKSQSKYAGLPYHITKGHVMQAQEDDAGNTTLLVELTDKGYGFWDDIIAVYYEGNTDAVDSDFVEVWGTLGEKWDYTTKIGGSNSVPTMEAESIEVIGHND